MTDQSTITAYATRLGDNALILGQRMIENVAAYPEQIRRLIPNPVTILGTDGYGRSDEREVLRRFFKVDRYHVAVAALGALARQGTIDQKKVAEAIARYGIDPEAPHAPNA